MKSAIDHQLNTHFSRRFDTTTQHTAEANNSALLGQFYVPMCVDMHMGAGGPPWVCVHVCMGAGGPPWVCVHMCMGAGGLPWVVMPKESSILLFERRSLP